MNKRIVIGLLLCGMLAMPLLGDVDAEIIIGETWETNFAAGINVYLTGSVFEVGKYSIHNLAPRPFVKTVFPQV